MSLEKRLERLEQIAESNSRSIDLLTEAVGSINESFNIIQQQISELKRHVDQRMQQVELNLQKNIQTNIQLAEDRLREVIMQRLDEIDEKLGGKE